MSEQMHRHSTKHEDSEPSTQMPMLGSEVKNQRIETNAADMSVDAHQNLQVASVDVTRCSCTKQWSMPPEDVNKSNETCTTQQASEKMVAPIENENGCCNLLPLQPEVASKDNQAGKVLSPLKNTLIPVTVYSSENVPAEIECKPCETSCVSVGRLELYPAPAKKRAPVSTSGQLFEVFVGLGSIEELRSPCGDIVNNLSHDGNMSEKSVNKSKQLKCSPKVFSKCHVLRSSVSKKKEHESNHSLEDAISGQNKSRATGQNNEHIRIKTHLKYLLNRINYEQNLIDAYSAEGWKGQSAEKLKPEKELQRANSEILRRKLKIRNLFRHIDGLCAHGRLPESLFDSEGQIGSEDIFCAKCGSKDLSTDNDIILCDGACYRGFHQFCLEPPLLKEDIPPGEESWLCPSCECKLNCIGLLNYSQGTKLIITDSCEKVFPESVAAGNQQHQDQDPDCGLPSDESADDAYNPDDPETDGNDELDVSSDDSDSGSTSHNHDLSRSLSSDDSEDADFDPEAPEMAKKENISSGKTADSENVDVNLEEDEYRLKGGAPESATSLANSCGPSLHVSKKRRVQSLDYKKLFDETYRDFSSSSSSDDEDWTASRKRRQRTRKSDPSSTNRSVPLSETGMNVGVTEESRQKAYLPDENKLAPKSPQLSSKSSRSSVYKKLGEATVQRLYKSFKENQYPDKAAKESLSRELNITYKQVTKWFENTRWSLHHSSTEASTVKTISVKDINSRKI